MGYINVREVTEDSEFGDNLKRIVIAILCVYGAASLALGYAGAMQMLRYLVG